MTPTEITRAIRSDLRTLGLTLTITWKWNGRFTNRIGDAQWLSNGRHEIRFGTKTFKVLSEESQRETVAHEVAHIAAIETYGPRIAPHGWQWKRVMARLGYHDASATEDLAKQSVETVTALRAIRRKKVRHVAVCQTCSHEFLLTAGKASRVAGYRCSDRGHLVLTGEIRRF